MSHKMVGDILREARLEKQLQLTDVEKTTGIAVQHLLALELDQFSLLPADQAETYLMSYAEVVGLNADDLRNQYEKQVSFQNTLPHFPVSEPVVSPIHEEEEDVQVERTVHRRRRSHREETQKKSNWPVILLSALALALALAIIATLAYLAFQYLPTLSTAFKGENPETTTVTMTEVTSVMETTTIAETTQNLTAEVQADGNSLVRLQTSKEQVDVVFTLKEGESWVGLNDGINGDQGTILTGEQSEFTVTVNKGTSAFVTVGMPQSATVTVDGQEVDLGDLVNYSPATFTLTVE